MLPELVELDLSDTGNGAAVIRMLPKHPTLAQRIRRVRVSTRFDRVAATLAVAPPGLEVEFVRAYTFPGDPQGEVVRVAGDRVTLVSYGRKIDASYPAQILQDITTIRELVVEAPAGARIDEPSWAALENVLGPNGVTPTRPQT
jgi:hypothetical protein